jgi:serine/threonine protein kinase
MNDAAQEMIGRTLGGRFRLTGFLGEGAMAAVFRGEQDEEPRAVAVKIMHQELLRDVTFAKRFTREAKAAARIVHRNSVRIIEHGADGDLLYLAMELCAGEDLFDLLARERRLPEARAARIVAQVCGALSAAHAHGVVHRDLKPENVMILPDPAEPGADLVKVLDFGIAKILDREPRGGGGGDDEEPVSEPIDSSPPSSVLTKVGGLLGTPEYMSPEQSLGQPVDPRSDVYACGVLLFHIVTGTTPFTGKTAIDVMMKHVDNPPPLPSTVLPTLHPVLEQVILKALSKAREARQQSAAELADDLENLLPDLETGPRASAPPRSSPRTLKPPSGAPSSGLRGVPAVVTIREPVSSSEPPPATLRSPAQVEEEAPEALVILVDDPLSAIADQEPAALAEEPSPVAAADAPLADLLPERSPAIRKVPVEDRWIAPWWAFALGVVILSVLIWLLRYLRFSG